MILNKLNNLTPKRNKKKTNTSAAVFCTRQHEGAVRGGVDYIADRAAQVVVRQKRHELQWSRSDERTRAEGGFVNTQWLRVGSGRRLACVRSEFSRRCGVCVRLCLPCFAPTATRMSLVSFRGNHRRCAPASAVWHSREQ